jgi:hypothetical protein
MAPLRNEAVKKSFADKVTMADDDVIYPITSNKNLITEGLAPEDDDDMSEDAAFFDTGSSVAPIYLDASGGGDGMWIY